MSSWILLAFASAISAGMVSILGKLGVTKTPSNLATAIRTAVVLGLAWAIVAITGATAGLSNIDQPALIFLMLSGLTTGASWIMFFKTLQTGDNKSSCNRSTEFGFNSPLRIHSPWRECSRNSDTWTIGRVSGNCPCCLSQSGINIDWIFLVAICAGCGFFCNGHHRPRKHRPGSN